MVSPHGVFIYPFHHAKLQILLHGVTANSLYLSFSLCKATNLTTWCHRKQSLLNKFTEPFCKCCIIEQKWNGDFVGNVTSHFGYFYSGALILIKFSFGHTLMITWTSAASSFVFRSSVGHDCSKTSRSCPYTYMTIKLPQKHRDYKSCQSNSVIVIKKRPKKKKSPVSGLCAHCLRPALWHFYFLRIGIFFGYETIGHRFIAKKIIITKLPTHRSKAIHMETRNRRLVWGLTKYPPSCSQQCDMAPRRSPSTTRT